ECDVNPCCSRFVRVVDNLAGGSRGVLVSAVPLAFDCLPARHHREFVVCWETRKVAFLALDFIQQAFVHERIRTHSYLLHYLTVSLAASSPRKRVCPLC